MIKINEIFAQEIQQINELIERRGANIFIEIEDDFIKEALIDQIIGVTKIKRAIFIRDEAREYEVFISSILRKFDESFKKMTRGLSFSPSDNKSESRKTTIIRLIEYISKYYSLIIIIDKIEDAKQSVIDFIEDLSTLSLDTGAVTILFANSRGYSFETIEKINKIKESKNFEVIRIKNLNFEDYSAVIEQDYTIPLDILLEMYELSEGSLKDTFSEISLLRSKRYIDEIGRWVGPDRIPEDIPRGTGEFISFRYKMLDDNKKDVLRWLSMVDEELPAETLKNISGLNDSQFINAIEGLNELEIIKITGDKVEFYDRKMKNFVRSSLSEYSRASMAKVILNNIKELNAPAKINLLIEAGEYEKAEEVILSNTNGVGQRNIVFYKGLIEDLLKKRKSEKLLLRYSRLLLYQGHREKAAKVLKEIEDSYPQPSSGYFALKAWQMSYERVDGELDTLLERAKEPVDKTWVMYYKMYSLWQKGETALAQDIGRKLTETDTPIRIKGEALRIMGNIALDNKKFDEALEYYEKARAISEQIGDSLNLARILSNESNVYFSKGNENMAFELMEKSTAISKENLDIPAYIIVEYNKLIAEYDFKRITYQEFLKKMERMENIVRKYGSPNLIENYLLTNASVHLFSLDLEKFREYIEKTEADVSMGGNKSQISRMEIMKSLYRIIKGDNVEINRGYINQLNALDYVVLMIITGNMEEASTYMEKLSDENESIYYKALIRLMKGEKPETIENEFVIFLKRNSIFSDFLRDILELKKGGHIDYNKYIETGNALTLVVISKLLDEPERKKVINLIRDKKNIDLSHILA